MWFLYISFKKDQHLRGSKKPHCCAWGCPVYPFSFSQQALTWCAAPFAEKVTVGEGAAVITPPDTRSMVVPGLASCEAAGTDFRVLSGNFTSEACPAVAACSNQKAKWQRCTTCSSSALETYVSKSCQSGLWDAGIFPTSWIVQPLRFPYTKVEDINKCTCKSPFVIHIFKLSGPSFKITESKSP